MEFWFFRPVGRPRAAAKGEQTGTGEKLALGLYVRVAWRPMPTSTLSLALSLLPLY